ncbi:unnamed protein product [Lota lota]
MEDDQTLCTLATFIYFFINLLWLVATFTLQLLKGSLSISIPKYNNQLVFTGEYIKVEPVSFMFLITFVVLILLQFFTMLFHRTYTLIHFIGYVNTELRTDQQQGYNGGDSSKDPEAYAHEPTLYSTNEDEEQWQDAVVTPTLKHAVLRGFEKKKRINQEETELHHEATKHIYNDKSNPN